jgi:hypothetical protein
MAYQTLNLKLWHIQMGNRRKTMDRRSNNLKQDKEHRCNRRYRPCRRLNNISAKWFPSPREVLMRHPVIRSKFHQLGYGRGDNE